VSGRIAEVLGLPSFRFFEVRVRQNSIMGLLEATTMSKEGKIRSVIARLPYAKLEDEAKNTFSRLQHFRKVREGILTYIRQCAPNMYDNWKSEIELWVRKFEMDEDLIQTKMDESIKRMLKSAEQEISIDFYQALVAVFGSPIIREGVEKGKYYQH
jgi:hypothetical protein